MNDAFEALRARFRARAQTDAQDVLLAMHHRDYETLERVVHSLAGAAGLFGYQAISDHALAIDAEFVAGIKPSDEALKRLVGIILSDCELYS